MEIENSLPNIVVVNECENDINYKILYSKYESALSSYLHAVKLVEKHLKRLNRYRRKYGLEDIKLW